MRIIFSIIINALILYALVYFLNTDLETGITIEGGLNTYIAGGAILGIMNFTIKPVLKILSLPLFFVFLGLVSFFINGIILWLFDYIVNNILAIPGMSFSINGTINFIIAVAIFTILNMFYSLLFKK